MNEEAMRIMELPDMLAGLADDLAEITLRTLPGFPKGRWGKTMFGMRQQPDGTFEGDPSEN
jgi:hypothetical protein